MSKESYIRGFCKAAQAAGVDAAELAKFAADADTKPKMVYVPAIGRYRAVEGAGIGDNKDNYLYSGGDGGIYGLNGSGYFNKLYRNLPRFGDLGEVLGEALRKNLGIAAPKAYLAAKGRGMRYRDIGKGGTIQQEDLAERRAMQAAQNANLFAARGTDVWHRIKSWLERTGRENQLDFIGTGTVHPGGADPAKRDADRTKALKGIEGIDLNRLRWAENSQASNSRPGIARRTA